MKTMQKTFDYLPLVVILTISAALHLWRIESLMTFGGDLGYDLINVKGIINGNLTLLGPRIGPYNGISNLYLGPIYYYLLAPFLWLTKLDPVGAAYASILARLGTSLFVYLVTKKVYGNLPAVFATIISVISPYWINHLGFPSNPYFILPTVSLIIFLLTKVNNSKSLFNISIIGFLIGVSINFHYISVILFIPTIIYLRQKIKILSINKISALSIGFLISMSSQIAFELRNNFYLTNQLLKQFSSGSLNPNIISVYSNLKTNFYFLSENIFGSYVISIFLAFLVILIIVENAKKSKVKINPISFFLFNLILINILASTFYPGGLQPHYMAPAYPAIFILSGLAIVSLKKLNKFLPMIFLIIISINLLINKNLMSPSGYTMPEDLTLKEIRKISKVIAIDSEDKTFNITSTLDGDSRAMPYRYLVQSYGKKPLSVEHYDDPESLYVISRDPPSAITQNNLFEISSFQPSHISRVWEIKGNIRLVKLSKKEKASRNKENFVVIVNPVRSRDLWVDKSLKHIAEEIRLIDEKNLKATWLLQYDVLKDEELVNVFRSLGKNHEIGLFLEISQEQATDSKVSYKLAQGDYYRPDKVFLSGYTPDERKKLVEGYLNKFNSVFKKIPNSVGAWYIDANTQNFLSEKGVKAALTVADQYDTDGASIWGKYFSYPFYPSKYNSLEPAMNEQNKISLVNIQWAQRHPIFGYGALIKDSRQSFQANDYINNGYNHSYFDSLMSIYLNNQKTEFTQITIGLETGQEAITFFEEFEKQLSKIESLSDESRIQALTMSEFSNWYTNKYPGISPSHFLETSDNLWYMSPKFRVAIFKEGDNFIVKDLRYYKNLPFKDYFYSDKNSYLNRNVDPAIDNVSLKNEINLGPATHLNIVEKFDNLTLKLDDKTVKINQEGLQLEDQYLYKKTDQDEKIIKRKLSYLIVFQNIRNIILRPFTVLKYSKIENKRVLGIAISPTRLIGFSGINPGAFQFEPQVLNKFLSPDKFFKKWEPWIN